MSDNQHKSSETKNLRQIVDIDYDYLERKARYEELLAQGNPNATPPEFSTDYRKQRDKYLQSASQKNQQLPCSNIETIAPYYSVQVDNSIKSDPLTAYNNQPSMPVQVPLPRVQQFNPVNPTPQTFELNGVVPATPMSEPVIIGDFMVKNDGYYYTNRNGQWVRLTDFFITVAHRETCVAVDNSVSQKFSILLTNDLGHQKQLSVPLESWMNLQNQIEREAPEFQIFTDEQHNAKEKFKRLLSEILKYTKIPEKIVYDHWGWGQISEDGTRRFFHGGLPDCTSEKILLQAYDQQYHHCNTLAYAWGILDVGEHYVTIPTVLYCLASYVDALFMDAGYPLAHCLMLVGESGTMKTSFSKVVFAPFSPENDRVHTVRSTEASLRVLHEKCYDDTLVIDDFNLEGSPREFREKMNNIRALIRAYSDKTPRAKYGGKDNVKKYALRGGCVFTGETKLVGQIKSSELRYIKVIFKEKLNGYKLAFFQENPWVWPYFVATFIRHLERYYVCIIAETKQTFALERNSTKLENARLIDAFLHLKIVAKVFCKVFWEAGLLSSEQFNPYFDYLTSILRCVVSQQEQDVATQEPHLKFLGEVLNLIGTGELRIASNIDEYIQDMRRYAGYKNAEDRTIMMKKDSVYNRVQTALSDRGDYLPVSADELSKILKDKGFTKHDAGSCLKKAPSKIGGRPRMLALIEQKCFEALQEQPQ